MKLRLHARLRALGLRATLAVAGFAAYSTSGCLSNQYTITKDELTRVVQLPPAARGERGGSVMRSSPVRCGIVKGD